VVTRCATVSDFLTMFHPFVVEGAIFVPSKTPKEVGRRITVTIQLSNGDTVMQGEGEVVQARTTSETSKRTGMWLRLSKTDERTAAIMGELSARRERSRLTPLPLPPVPMAGPTPPPGPLPAPPPGSAPQQEEQRTPGAAFTLPANPFSELPPEALEHFIDCTLYEDTGATEAVPPGDDDTAVGGAPEMPVPPADELTAPRQATVPPVAVRAPSVPPEIPASSPEPAPARFPTPPPITPVLRPMAPPAATGTRTVILIVAVTAALALGLVGGYALRGGGSEGARAASSSTASSSTTSSSAKPAAGTESSEAGAATPTETPTETPTPNQTAIDPSGACSLALHTNPTDAEVTANGKVIGRTPLKAAPIPCGDVALSINHPRYVQFSKNVHVDSGTTLTLNENLTRPTAILDITTVPPGANVTVQGAGTHAAPASVPIDAFTSIRVDAQLAGYKPWTQYVYSKGGHLPVRIVFEKAGGGTQTPRPKLKPQTDPSL
jgi:hypothetical protein